MKDLTITVTIKHFNFIKNVDQSTKFKLILGRKCLADYAFCLVQSECKQFHSFFSTSKQSKNLQSSNSLRISFRLL